VVVGELARVTIQHITLTTAADIEEEEEEHIFDEEEKESNDEKNWETEIVTLFKESLIIGTRQHISYDN